MDALTHAIEAYAFILHCEYTDALSIHSIQLIHRNLVKSYNNDIDTWHALYDAQCMTRMGFSFVIHGVCHQISQKTGPAYSG